MKARISRTPVKKVLCCGLSAEREQIVKLCAADFSAEVVTAEDTALTIGQLLEGMKGSGQAPADECLVFAGFDRNDLNGLLESLKMSGIRIPLKAVLTPHNGGWRLCDLIEELKREHEQMNGGGAK